MESLQGGRGEEQIRWGEKSDYPIFEIDCKEKSCSTLALKIFHRAMVDFSVG